MRQNKKTDKIKGKNYLFYCDDILNALKQIPSSSVDLIITSPPYNLGKKYEKKRAIEYYLTWQKEIIEECVNRLKPNGSICWQVGNYVKNGAIQPLDILLYPVFNDLGLLLRNRIIWHFGHGLHCKKRLSGRYETILWFTKNNKYIFNLDPIRVPQKYPNKKHFKGNKKGQLSCNPLGKNPSDIWEIPNVKSNHVEKTEHPCQFPVELVERLVLSLSNPKNTVFDPFMGVGSSAIASLMHGRKFIGVDNNKKYVKIAERRIKEALTSGIKIRPMWTKIYDPKGKGKEKSSTNLELIKIKE